jgi:hypothetical protein
MGLEKVASLNDDTTKMNDRNKHEVTGQMNHQIAAPKANASEFLFLPNAHFFKNNFSQTAFGTFGFALLTSRPIAKPKERVDIRSLYQHEHIAPDTLIKTCIKLPKPKAAKWTCSACTNSLVMP